jgi:hypothetical protein
VAPPCGDACVVDPSSKIGQATEIFAELGFYFEPVKEKAAPFPLPA